MSEIGLTRREILRLMGAPFLVNLWLGEDPWLRLKN